MCRLKSAVAVVFFAVLTTAAILFVCSGLPEETSAASLYEPVGMHDSDHVEAATSISGITYVSKMWEALKSEDGMDFSLKDMGFLDIVHPETDSECEMSKKLSTEIFDTSAALWGFSDVGGLLVGFQESGTGEDVMEWFEDECGCHGWNRISVAENTDIAANGSMFSKSEGDYRWMLATFMEVKEDGKSKTSVVLHMQQA